MMNKIVQKSFLTIILLLVGTMAFSQNIAVQSFAPDRNDQEARITSVKKDQNNKVCAIIKIETPLLLHDFDFEAGMVAVTATEQKTGVIWVYLSPGARKITINHKHLGSIRNYEFGESLKEATVYIMKLKSGNVKTIVEDNVNLQYFVVNCSVPGATIKIDGNPSEAFSNGMFQKLLSYGKHQYTIEAPMYYPLSGQIEIRASEKSSLTPDLKPAFAIITLTGDGDIYVNDERKGTNAWNGRLMPGAYKVEVKKASHRSSVGSFEVKAGENKTFPLQAPAPIYGLLNISANVVDATIFIDGVKQKETTPTIINQVLIGTHWVELQAKGYKPYQQIVEVAEGKIAEMRATLEKTNKTEKENRKQPQIEYPQTEYPQVEQSAKSKFFIEYAFSKAAPLGITLGGYKKWGGYGRFKLNPSVFDMVESADISLLDYNDKTYSRFALTGGLMVRLFNGCYLYGGGGFGTYGVAYKVNDDKGAYACPDESFQQGVELEAGAMVKIKWFSLSAGYCTILAGSSQRFGDINVGIGINF
ncbi:hypothetical protein AGMMS49965_21360 [Bacteroidia bacterium]|nr:hypothetical protein AGMMS49965_21360 [Bacteroidia bacterium]